MNIDMHAHYIPETCIDLTQSEPNSFTVAIAGGDGLPRYARNQPTAAFSEGVHQIYDLDRRLQDMASEGVDRQILSVPSGCYFYDEEPALAGRLCRHFNDAFATSIEAHPGRFTALANLPMQAPVEAASELERTVRDLGFCGAVIDSSINGLALDDPSFAPFYDKAQELDIPIFVHPGYIPALNRMARYQLSNFLGFPSETAFAAASLVFGGVLEEFPRLKVCLAHGGGCCSALYGRWEHGWHEITAARVKTSQPPSHYLKRFYYDSLVFDNALLEFIVQSAGADHVLLGTDYPTHMGNFHSVDDIDSLESPSASDKALIRGGNAQELFKLG